MNKLLLVFLFTVTILSVQSQGLFEWTEPVAVTDSISINANPFVWVHNNTSYMFYEKRTDVDSNSMIFRTELNGDETEVMLLGQDGTDYMQPLFIEHQSENYVGYLLCIANINGHNELYAAPYHEDNTLGNLYSLSQGDTVDHIAVNYNFHMLATLCDSNIYVSELAFTTDSLQLVNKVSIDANSCFNIDMGENTIAWEKRKNDSVAIFLSEYEYNPDSGMYVWSSPFELDVCSVEPDLTMNNTVIFGPFNILNWVRNDSIIGYYINEQTSFSYNTYDLTNLKEPTSLYWIMLVSNLDTEPNYLCYVSGNGINSEIYCSMGEYGWEDSARITKNNVRDENPVLFTGEETWPVFSVFVYNIWQSYRNGNIPLYMCKSKAILGSGVEENSSNIFNFSASPNPFTHKTLLTFSLPENLPANCKIYSEYGSLIKTIKVENFTGQTQSLSWIPEPDLPKGIYFITLTQHSKSIALKIIYQ